MLTLDWDRAMNTCLIRIAATIGLMGAFALGFALAAARHGGMLVRCVL